AQELANAALPAAEMAKLLQNDGSKSSPSESADAALMKSLELPDDVLASTQKTAVAAPVAPAEVPLEMPLIEAPVAATAEPAPIEETSNKLTEFGELALLATGEWQALQRSDVSSETKN